VPTMAPSSTPGAGQCQAPPGRASPRAHNGDRQQQRQLPGMQQPFQYPLHFSQLSQSSGMQLSGMTLSQDLPTMFAPVPAKRLRSHDNGGQQQQCRQQQLPGMQQQPFQYPLQFSGMQQQQLLTQFAAAANAPYMQYASGSTNINSTGSASSKSSKKKKKKKKEGKTGRRRGPPRGKYVDPRMTMAVKAKMANPNLPLQDALEAGGFIFVKDPNSNGMIDLDGTSLVQRKNNLCRRVRLEKEEQINPPPGTVLSTFMADNNNNNSAAAFAMPSANFQGLSFATTTAALAPQVPQVPQMQMQMQMGTSGIDFQHGSILTNDFQDYKLPVAAAAPTNNAGTFQQGNTPGGFPGTHMNMNSTNANYGNF